MTSHPGLKQSQASDPLRSVWVGASAGTGKTKVLIDRVLRLMLQGNTLPGKILCLTFTKTAAAEMSNRIYARLGGWSVKEDAELNLELEELTGTAPSPETTREARRLFARVLDTPGGLKIMTLHSFCQSVLKRFPVEAGLPPHFELMDEQNAIEYLMKCLHDIIGAARKSPDTVLASSFNQLTLHLDLIKTSELMQEIMAKRSLLSGILRAHGDVEGSAEKTVAAMYARLPPLPPAGKDWGEGALTDAEESELRKSLNALLQGSKSDQEAASCMQPWLEQKSRRAELFDDYCQAYFTAKGEVAKKLATKAAAGIYPDIQTVMQKEAARLDALRKERQTAHFAQVNAALLTVAAAMVGHYARHKRRRDKLDFDDLIIRTCDLLAAENMAPWVLFKLDAGIDHILVDEAQDTSRNQWQVISSLSEDFFSGTGQKTLFVVGDEKQSIFSFQGADPAEFARMQNIFGGRVQGVQQGWEIFLEYSFRSTRTVLEVVDGVFGNALTKRGVVFDLARDVRHLPFRAGQAGVAELWPLIKTAEKEKPEPWKMPTEIDTGDNAASHLARKIAATIRHWIDTKETLASRARLIRAGDILILVQSRGAFVELLMRALKEQNVPVAGVDRMTLTEEIAVMDLLALAQFALLPKDDLTLATVLKSPLAGLTEEDLYHLCHDRKGGLWQSVREKNQDLAVWLQGRIEAARSSTPYEFFVEALNTPCFADAVSGRRAFYGRLGFDIQDALDEFLNTCLHHEQSHTPSLQKFIDWFLRGEAEIKREQDHSGADVVRIMTVHGAKGLQAPIVFLPDTVKKLHDHNKGRVRLIWPEDEKGMPFWSPRAAFDAPLYTGLQAQARERQEEEYRRLLYVALTRAEDRLYICGHHGARAPKADCWYNLIAGAFPAAEKTEFTVDGDVMTVLRLEHPQEALPEKEKLQGKKSGAAFAPLPSWVFQPPPDEPFPAVPLAPSKPDEDEPAQGPLEKTTGERFSRGVIVHQILEILPQLPPEKWETALKNYLARPHLRLPPAQQASLASEILAVLRHQEFAPIFGPGSRAEVPVSGLLGTKILSGRMDRILVTEKEVLIIDYKTNRPPPRRAEDVPPVYLRQMAAYLAVMRQIYPGHAVKCALLWTDGPLLMPLSNDALVLEQ